MSYSVAIEKAWEDLKKITNGQNHAVYFLADTYDVSITEKKILSQSCNTPAKNSSSIIMLHYLIRRLKGLPPVEGEWISFRQLSGGAGYYPAFKKRVLATLMRKYGDSPKGLFDAAKKYKAEKADVSDMGFTVKAFPEIPILITYWRGEEELDPEVNILFDKSIDGIFCTEDIAVLAGIFAHSI